MTAVKITLEQALEIRRRYENLGTGGAGQTTLAAEFGVSRSVINQILAGRHSLVRGTRDIRAARQGSTWDGGHTPQLSSMSKGALKSVGDGRAPKRKSQQEHRQNPRPCPVCGARKGEYCTNMIGGGYQRDRKNVHDERRTP
jgi:hypothetical protein